MVTLVLAHSGWAEVLDLGRVSASTVTNVPIDVSNSVVPRAAFNQGTRARLNMADIFRRAVGVGSVQRGFSNLPPASSFPSTSYPNFFQPQKPIIPGQ
jgi:hypothetical protein